MFVNSVTLESATVTVQINNEDTLATIPRLRVELCDPSGQFGTFTLRFTSPSDISSAQQKYIQGETVTISV